MQQKNHEPALLDEVIYYLRPDTFALLKTEVCFVDCTVGFGGHAKEFVKRGLFVLAIDTDTETLKIAETNLRKACPPLNNNIKRPFYKFVHGNFKDIDTIVKQEHVKNIYGILIDLGVSTSQLTSSERGLSFSNPDAELDMRLDQTTSQVKASDLLNALNEKQLRDLFLVALDFKDARKLSQRIVQVRKNTLFSKVSDLLEAVDRTIQTRGKLHPATKAFMALRIAVNSEYENIEIGLPKAFSVLEKGGRLAVISFHSGEDRIVKEILKKFENEGLGILVTKKPVIPKSEELERNPKSRSAKLRVIEKL